jgi:hypothetical protein
MGCDGYQSILEFQRPNQRYNPLGILYQGQVYGNVQQVNQVQIQQPQPQVKPKLYTKLDETREGLNVYRYNFCYDPQVDSQFPYVCPICEEELEEKVKTDIIERINSGPLFLEDLYKEYQQLVEDKNKVLIFNDLAQRAYEIKLVYDNWDKHCFCKYICHKTKEEYYFCLFNITKEEAQKKYTYTHKDRRYDFENWKDDNKTLIQTLAAERAKEKQKIERRIKIQQFKVKVKKARIEIKAEWEKITFEKEYNIYLNQVNYIKSQASSISGSYPDLIRLLYNAWESFEYMAGQKKIAEFIAEYAESESTKQYFLNQANPSISAKEKKEYAVFEDARIPKMKIIVDPAGADAELQKYYK